MDVLDDLIAAGAPEWTVVLADEQTAGVGRAGRSWEAPLRSALLCSILVRPRLPPEQMGMLAIAVGVAMAQYLEVLGVSVQLKWPNDVLVDGRKLAGILIRTRVDSQGAVANVGIGVNLVASCTEPGNRAALSACGVELPDTVEMVGRVVEHLAGTLGSDDTWAIGDVWMRKAAFLDEAVVVEDERRRIAGKLRGIDHSGRLLIEEEHGVIHVIAAGDLVRGPRREWA